MIRTENRFPLRVNPEQTPVTCSSVCLDLLKRVGKAVNQFFTTFVLFTYHALQWATKVLTIILLPKSYTTANQGIPIENMGITEKELLPEPLILEASVSSGELTDRRTQALNRMGEIKVGEIEFSLVETVRAFDLDAALTNYDSTRLPRIAWQDLFNYADPGPEYGFCLKQVRFSNILRDYPLLNPSESDQRKEIRESLSRVSHMFERKKELIGENVEQQNALKQQIRSTILQIIDAHENCIDQVLAQMEEIQLKTLQSIQKSGALTAKEQLQAQAGLLLFSYKCNLIKYTCQKLYPHEPHMADLERALRVRVAEAIDLGSDLTGAVPLFDHLVNDLEVKLSQCEHAVKRRYTNNPACLIGEIDHWGDIDERPIAYMLRELKAPEQHNPMNALRTNLLSWGYAYFGLADCEELSIALSEDPNNVIAMGGNLSRESIKFLLESAGVIHPAH
jgi:hypothetical protein